MTVADGPDEAPVAGRALEAAQEQAGAAARVRHSGPLSKTTTSSLPSSSFPPGLMTAPEPYCGPFAKVTTKAASSSRSPPASMTSPGAR